MSKKDEYTKGKYVIIIEGEKSKIYQNQNNLQKTQEYYDKAVEEIKSLEAKLLKAEKNDDKTLVSYIKNSIVGRRSALEMLKNKLNIIRGNNEESV